MILAADILKRPAPAAPPGRDPRIAVAWSWVCMLDALSAIAVRFSDFLTHEIEPAIGRPKGPILAIPCRGDPLDAFVRAARAMRLAIALAFRIENEIDALRAGKSLGPDSCISQTSRAEAAGTTDRSQAVGEMPSPGEKDHQIALQAIAEAAETPKRPEGLLGRFNSKVREDPAFYRLLKGPLKDAIAAICADLGLKPDWGLWTENGFPPPPGGREEDWIAFFVRKGDTGPAPHPERPPPLTPPRAGVRDPRHVLDPPRRDLNAFLAAHGIQPLPPPPGQRSACALPHFALRPPRAASGLPTSL